jgi:hypothetical protein
MEDEAMNATRVTPDLMTKVVIGVISALILGLSGMTNVQVSNAGERIAAMETMVQMMRQELSKNTNDIQDIRSRMMRVETKVEALR